MVRGVVPRRFVAIVAFSLWQAAVNAAAGAEADGSLAAYVGAIRPLLAERCFSCHGGLKQEAGLRLDTASSMLAGGESGPAVVRGAPDASLLVARTSDPAPVSRMPPEGEGAPLSAGQIALLRAWIAAGCPTPPDEKPEADPRSHWAFQPRVRPEVPIVTNTAWVRNPIDAFLAAAHEQAGVSPRPEAARHVLVRRLFIDLVGLPPEPEDLAALEADRSPDWYERLVDRLLADPRHGERWGRHWMDIWRYSDWWGLGDQLRYSQKHMWHYRDWIIESLNADLPYDEMIRQMLAADELSPDDPAKLRATGFLARNWFLFNRTPWLDETVEHVGKGLLGLTLNCAKCHAHKYDPVSQEDFYRMRAFFEPISVRLDVVPGEADLERDGIPRVFDGLLDAPTYRFVRGEDTKPDTSRPIRPGVPAVISLEDLATEPVALPPTAFEPERRPWVLDAHVATARRTVEAAETALAKAAELEAAARTALAAAGPQATRALPAAEKARDTVATAERAVATAGASLAVAEAGLESVVRRAEATRVAWLAGDTQAGDTGPGDEPAARHAAVRAAVQAERRLAAAQARRMVTVLEGRLAAAAADKRAAVEMELASARVAADQATSAAALAVGEADLAFTPLYGAKWTPTRFRHSGADDPPVAFPASSSGRRKALAGWIVDPRNPLTARVAVNHIWMRHVGRPLVATVFDFGRKGDVPTHPQLLDWLASELVTGPPGGRAWSMKHLHRLIVTSAGYRMGSATAGAAASLAADPDNRLFWRREPLRLESQVVRDCILAVSGALDATMGGPSIPAGEQPRSRRRSVYFWHSDIDRNRFLTAFDDAPVKDCYRREQSIVPQQALALANAALVHDAAAGIAARIVAAGGTALDDEEFLDRAFVMLLCRRSSPDERAACAAALGRWRALGQPAAAGADPARVHLVWALLNHNDFVTLR